MVSTYLLVGTLLQVCGEDDEWIYRSTHPLPAPATPPLASYRNKA